MSLSGIDSAKKYLFLFTSKTFWGSPKLDSCFFIRIVFELSIENWSSVGSIIIMSDESFKALSSVNSCEGGTLVGCWSEEPQSSVGASCSLISLWFEHMLYCQLTAT